MMVGRTGHGGARADPVAIADVYPADLPSGPVVPPGLRVVYVCVALIGTTLMQDRHQTPGKHLAVEVDTASRSLALLQAQPFPHPDCPSVSRGAQRRPKAAIGPTRIPSPRPAPQPAFFCLEPSRWTS